MPAFGSSAKWLRGAWPAPRARRRPTPGRATTRRESPSSRGRTPRSARSAQGGAQPQVCATTTTLARPSRPRRRPRGQHSRRGALTASPAPTTPSRPRRDKFSDHEQVRTPGKRRVVVDSDDSDDSLANTPTSAHLSLRRGVLGSKPTPLSGGRSRSRILDSDEDVDDAPIARTPRSAAAKPKSSSKPAKSASPLASTRSASAASPRRAAPAPGEVPGEAAAHRPS